MNGLLRKELCLLKASGRYYLLLVAIFLVLGFINGGTYLSVMIPFILIILPINSFSVDEQARWDKFAAALPGGRRAVVRAKYQLLLLLLAGLALLSAAANLSLVPAGLAVNVGLIGLMLSTILTLTAGILLNSLLFPLLFKYGVQKSRIILCIIVGCGTALAVMLISFLTVGGGLEKLPDWVGSLFGGSAGPALTAGAAVILSAAALALSYRVSCRVYDKKEF